MVDTRQLPMPLTYARLILQKLGTTPQTRTRLLAGTRITEAALADPAAETVLADLLIMLENADRLCDPGWAFELNFDLAAQGALGFAMVCAPTLAEAFDVMARYGHVRAPWFRLREFREGDRWGLQIVRQFPIAPHLDVAMVESVELSAQNLVESVLGRKMSAGRMCFDYPAPPWRERYLASFSGEVIFDNDYAGLTMPALWRDSLCPLADAGMYQAALSRLEMERRRLESADVLSLRVAMLLAAAGDSGLDLATTARQLGMSRRTLLRRLAEAGTSFGDLLDAHRRDRAGELLRNPQYSVTEVAYRLGYSEPANFTRAFRKWTGLTPSGFRRRQSG